MVRFGRRPADSALVGDGTNESIGMAAPENVSELSALRTAAIEAVRQACEATQYAHDTLTTSDRVSKDDDSPVTVADFAAQALICHHLLAECPGVPGMGEESAETLRGSAGAALLARVVDVVQVVRPDMRAGEILDAIDAAEHEGGPRGRFWAIDPIDGTKGFLKRNGQWAVALGLVDDGRAVLGVLGCPALPVDPAVPDGERGIILDGVVGGGSMQRRLRDVVADPIHVAGPDAPLIVAESAEASHKSGARIARIRQAIGAEQCVPMDSQAKYALVARGEATVYLRVPIRRTHGEHLWDHVAGVAVVEAAGGRATDLFGEPLDFGRGLHIANNLGILATNGPPHDRIVATIRADYETHPSSVPLLRNEEPL